MRSGWPVLLWLTKAMEIKDHVGLKVCSLQISSTANSDMMANLEILLTKYCYRLCRKCSEIGAARKSLLKEGDSIES